MKNEENTKDDIILLGFYFHVVFILTTFSISLFLFMSSMPFFIVFIITILTVSTLIIELV